MDRPSRRIAAQAALDAILVEEEEEVDSDDSISDVQHIDDVHLEAAGDLEENVSSTDSDSDDNIPVRVRVRRRPNPNPEENTVVQTHTDKDGQRWSNVPPVQRRRDAANVLAEAGGPTANSNKVSILETWQLYFTNDILQKILSYSQRKVRMENIPIELTMESLKAYIAILYFRGANQDNKIPVEDLWSDNYSTFYRTVMSRTLFKIWNRCIRFDDIDLREHRKESDTFAAVREVWSEWNGRLRQFFKPTECICVDEQLVASRCRSPHRIYNPSKPGKYGELIRWCCDSNVRYFLNGDPLTKRPTNIDSAAMHKEANKAKNLVLSLSEPFLDKGHNVTGDRFFSSLDIAETLLQRRTTYVGTVATNKRHLPPVLHETKERFQSTFVYGGSAGKVTQQSYQVKAKKKVYMISTLHHEATIQDDVKQKSSIQLYYNSSKAGVDTCDEMCKNYTTRVCTRRWTVVHFHNMLDVSGINALTIYNVHHPEWVNISVAKRRRTFILKLASELAADFMTFRLQDPIGLPSSTVVLLKKFIAAGQPQPLPPQAQREPQPLHAAQAHLVARCSICHVAGKAIRDSNKTKIRCGVCAAPVCGKHSQPTGHTCNQCL